MTKTLVTGCAGFIGYHVSKELLARGEEVIGIDNLNSYYDVSLKEARLALLDENPNFTFIKLDISDREKMQALGKECPDITHIVHLAAQAGVRYSLENPYAYLDSNLEGQLNMLELARYLTGLEHLVYASSSSVYGANTKLPFSEDDFVDTPVSFYAATKKSCELMTYTYAHLYKIPATGLRYFTVYGPWGRPDMSPMIFTKAMFAGEEIPVFNKGDMRRNFTYVDDIVEGTLKALGHIPNKDKNGVQHIVYNIGNSKSEALMDFIKTLESVIGVKANLSLQPMQPGDVKETVADITHIQQDLNYNPTTNIEEGLGHFVNWYREYYKV